MIVHKLFGLEPAVFVALLIPTVTTLWRFSVWMFNRRIQIVAEFVQLSPMMTPKYEPWVDDRNKLPRVEQQIQIQNLGQTTIWIRGFDIFDFDTEELISPDRSREHQSNIPLPKDRHMTYRLPLDMEKRFKIEVRYSKSQNSKRTKLVTLYLDGYMLGLVETDYPPMS